MNIEDLTSLASVVKPIAKQIELLASRIKTNRSAWSGNETATRLQLIDPLLREIGWDTADPDQVTPEYSVGSRSADYVLRVGKLPVAVIEAKNLGVKIDADSRLQAHSYVDSHSIQYVIVTNGDRWELYSSNLSETKPLGAFSISRDNTYLSAIEAAKLSRNVMVATGSVPNNQRLDQTIGVDNGDGSQGSSSDKTDRFEPKIRESQGPADGRRWVSLGQLEFERGARRPNLMQLPDGKQVPINSWKKLWIEVAEWVTVNFEVGRELRFGHLDNMAIRTENVDFWNGFGQQLTSGYWVAGGTINTHNSVEYARALLGQVGVDVSNVLFKFE